MCVCVCVCVCVNSLQITLFSNERLEFICLHTVK